MEQGNTDWTGLLQVILLLLFTLFVTIGAITTTNRLRRYAIRHETIPVILWRDVIARNGLALPFIAIMVVRSARAFGVDVDPIVNDWPWVMFTSSPAVIGAAIYAYFELFIIERDTDYPGTNGNGSAGP
jgi:hypothetical protein